MEKFVIDGGTPLSGTVIPAGNKNAALPILAASALTADEVVVRNVPRIRDVEAMLRILRGLGVPRETRMAKTLFAVDELSGFILACAYVRPEGIHGLTPKSVKKKLKQPSFAAGVNRHEVRQGAEELGVDFDDHIAKVIAAMEERADELGLGPRDEDAAA